MKKIVCGALLFFAGFAAEAGTLPANFFTMEHPRTVVQTTYTAPVLPPLFSAADLANSATLMTDIGNAYNAATALLLTDDAALFALQQQVASLGAGIVGPAGPAGPAGPQGDPGPQGAEGPAGAMGLTGIAGATGPAGANGATGAQGPTGAVGPMGPQGPAGNGTGAAVGPMVNTSAIAASSPAAQVVATCFPAQGVVGFITAGETVDFAVSVPAAGNYLLEGCVASPNNPAKWHFEYPIGTKIGATLSTSNTGSYGVYAYQAASASVALPAGAVTIRVVFEAAGMNFGGFSMVAQ